MIQLVECKTAGEIRQYIDFTRSVYQNDPYYRDSLSPLLQMVLTGKSAFCRQVEELSPILAAEDGKVLLAATLLYTKKLPGQLIVAFFEALPGAETALAALLAEAKKRCYRAGLNSIVFGLNGHVNYGLGMQTDHFDAVPCFGSAYNPDYYAGYFTAIPGIKIINMVSYHGGMQRLEEQGLISDEMLKRSAAFSYRIADLSQLEREVDIYTELNNRCFADHPLYWERTAAEDMELFRPFKLFIGGENLILAEKEGQPVGFLLWYPDFNQLIRPGKGMNLVTYVKNKLMKNSIDRFKITEIGVLPEYQRTTVAAGLFAKCLELVRGRYAWGESGWILEDNTLSRAFGQRWGAEEYKHYQAYQLEINPDERDE